MNSDADTGIDSDIDNQPQRYELWYAKPNVLKRLVLYKKTLIYKIKICIKPPEIIICWTITANNLIML